MKLKSFGQTDVGKRRDHNEDCIFIDEQTGLYVVADGMGGHAAGEVASATSVDVLKEEFKKNAALIESFKSNGPDEVREQILKMIEAAVQKACATVYKMGQEDLQQHGMGTTLSVMLISDSGGFIAHVGDSRIYLVREDQVHQLSIDHTLVNEQLKRGTITKEDAHKARYKNVITRALGIQESVRVDTLHLDILPEDKFLLCSDGLHGYLKPGEVKQIIKSGPDADVCQKFIDLANERGGKDNISIVYIDVAEDKDSTTEELRQRMTIMRDAPMFKYLSYRELVTLMNLTYIRTVRDQEIIIEENITGDEMFILVQGSAQVLKSEQEIANLPHGSHFGEMALIDNAPRSATIKALGPTRLLVIGRKQFYEYIRKDAAAGVKLLWSFLQILTIRLRSTDERLREVQEELSIQEIQPEWILSED
jgi:serine/threonine protein phosphatase PrpC/CRP-like cAMP-binding protein